MLRLQARTGLKTIGVEGLIVDETETQVVWRAYKIARADPYLQVICGVQSADNRHESLLIEIVRGYRSGQRDPDALAH